MKTKITFDQVQSAVVTPFFHTETVPAPPAVRGARAFFGVGNAHNQGVTGSVTGGSWLQSFDVPVLEEPVIGWAYMENQARVASVSDFGVGISGIARTSGGGIAIGSIGAVINDSDTPYKAWALYVDAVKTNEDAGDTSSAEFEVANVPGPSPLGGMTPYRNYVEGMVNNLLIGAGSDASVFGRSYAIDSFINFGNNGSCAHTGINFRFDSLLREGVADDTTSPGNSGYGRAVAMGYAQGLSWYSQNPSGAVGSGTQAEVVRLQGNVTLPTHRSTLSFTDSGLSYRKRVGTPVDIVRFNYDPDATQTLLFNAGKASTIPGIGVEGTEADINILIAPKGTGTVVLGGVRPFADNAAAAAGGVPVNGIYRLTDGTLKFRLPT